MRCYYSIPLCDILNSSSITFSFSFCLFSVTVFPHIQQSDCYIHTPQISPLSWIFFLRGRAGGETSPEYGIDSSFCYFSQNINIFHMSLQFFALCKCRSCCISVVILVCSIQNRVEFYLLCHELCLRLYVSFFWVQSTHNFSKISGL